MKKSKSLPRRQNNHPKIVNLPSVRLPFRPFSTEEIDKEIRQRISKIKQEFSRGFEFIKKHPRSVTFFGSARLKPSHPYYQKAVRLGERLAEINFDVVTGGGPGIMEAANKGAYSRGGESLGLTIRLPNEQVANPYMTNFVEFYYFFSRKVCLTFSADAFLFFPGGLGTLDEFFEIITLVQTHKVSKVPMILVGESFWRPLEKYMKEVLLEQFGTISKSDLRLYRITDDDDEIVSIVSKSPDRQG